MAEIKYQRAYIDNDPEKIISIKEVTKENRNQYKYYCIGCGKELLPRAIESKYKKPHFYHKEIVECSGDDGSGLIVPPITVSNVPPVAE